MRSSQYPGQKPSVVGPFSLSVCTDCTSRSRMADHHESDIEKLTIITTFTNEIKTNLKGFSIKINPSLQFNTYWPFRAIFLILQLSIHAQVIPSLPKNEQKYSCSTFTVTLSSVSYLASSHRSKQLSPCH